MVCGVWYENDTHIVFTYVLHASFLGCLQHSAYIPCVSFLYLTIILSAAFFETSSNYGLRFHHFILCKMFVQDFTTKHDILGVREWEANHLVL